MKIAIYFAQQPHKNFSIQQVTEQLKDNFVVISNISKKVQTEELEEMTNTNTFTIINAGSLQAKYDYYLTTTLQDFNQLEKKLQQQKSKSVLFTNILNIFDFQYPQFDFTDLDKIVEVIRNPMYQLQQIYDLYSNKGVKFLHKELFLCKQ